MRQENNLGFIGKILQWICPEHLYEEIEGDLIQQYNRDLNSPDSLARSDKYRMARAKRRLFLNTIRFFRSGIILRNKFSIELNFINMMRSYFKFAFRHLLKSKVFSLLNIIGLGVGIASFLVITLYVDFEISYDQFHQNKNRIYRVAYEQHENGALKNASAKNFVGLGYWMKEQFPEVESYTRFWKIPANAKFLLQHNGKLFNESGNRIVADSTFFNVFPSLLQKGNPKAALKNKHSLVISEWVAKKIFGDEEPIGKIIASSEYNDQYEITGILKGDEVNAHLRADFISLHDYSWDTPEQTWRGPWRYTYIVLAKDVDKATFERKLNQGFKTSSVQNPLLKDVSFNLQSVTDIHLHSNFKDELNVNGNYKLIVILLVVGVVILILAWINYLNLETSRFISRAKEVGVRRIIGSRRSDLIFQFIVEFFCVNAIAIFFAISLLLLGLPYLSLYTGIQFNRFRMLQPEIIFGILILFGLGLILVGTYPAVLLSKINLALTLKGKFHNAVSQATSRKLFLNFQFVSSIVLIAFVIVVYQQVDFMRTSNKKIDLEKVVSIVNPTVYTKQEEKNSGAGGHANFTNLKNKLLQNPTIAAVSSSSAVPGETIGFTYVDLIKRNLGDAYDPTGYKLLFVDYDFISFYGLRLKAGRNYTTENGEDEAWNTLILNESAIKALDFSSAEDAVGREVYFMVDNDWNKYKIIGVLEDYHHEALKKNMLPTIFFLNHNRGQQVYYSVKLSAGAKPNEVLPYIEQTWKTIFPEKPFEYFFLDDHYDRQFKSELQFGTVFTLFAGVATFIACLGILGMTLFEVKARVKEISIRKVLGASVRNVVLLLSRNNLRMVLISAVLALPLIYYTATKWLSTYPVRIEISLVFFLIPVLLILSLVGIVSCVQILHAAQLNPVDNLKHE